MGKINFILKVIASCAILASVCMLTISMLMSHTINKTAVPIEDDTISGYESSGDIVDNINKNVYVITDPDTGVQYLVYSERGLYAGMGGITPRLNPDGSLCVVDTKNEEQVWTAPPQN